MAERQAEVSLAEKNTAPAACWATQRGPLEHTGWWRGFHPRCL